ncbi:MAG: Copper chaperone CopZ [Pseudomonadota bacterium]|jgi:copper chaperone CopZ
MEPITLGIDGMTCGGCVLSVERALGAVPGVTAVRVSLETREAVVTGDVPRARLTRAVEDAGFDVRPAG